MEDMFVRRGSWAPRAQVCELRVCVCVIRHTAV